MDQKKKRMFGDQVCPITHYMYKRTHSYNRLFKQITKLIISIQGSQKRDSKKNTGQEEDGKKDDELSRDKNVIISNLTLHKSSPSRGPASKKLLTGILYQQLEHT